MEKQLSEKLPRVEVVDALRGFAVMAILLVHSLEHFIFPVYPVTRNFAASLFRNIKYFTLRKLYLCRKWMQKRLQKTTTTGITLPNFDFLA